MSLEDVGSGKTMRPALRSFINEWILVALILPLALNPQRLAQIIMSYTEYSEALANVQPELWNIAQLIGVMLIAYILLMRVVIPIIANRYQITENRIVEIYGILKRDTNSTELSHIRRANAKIGFLARIMEICGFKPFGDLVCYTAGSGDEDLTLHGILEPGKVEERMREMLRASQAAAEGAHTGGLDPRGSNAASSEELTNIQAALASEREYRKDLERRVAILEYQVSPGSQSRSQPVEQVERPPQTSSEPDRSAQSYVPVLDADEVDTEPAPKMFGEGGELDSSERPAESFGLFVSDKQDDK